MKYPPLNCTILCKIAKIGKKYVTIETVETRDPDSGPIVGELTMSGPNQATLENARKESGAVPVRTWIDIAHHGNPEETVAGKSLPKAKEASLRRTITTSKAGACSFLVCW